MKETQQQQERFIDILGYEGLYQIGTNGTVISLERDKTGKGNSTYTTREMPLTTSTNKHGYVSVKLTNDSGVSKKYDIHRLVAINWIDNPHNKPQVNHIDGNKGNNSIDNLEWNTAQENMAHAVRMGLMPRGERHWKTTLTKKKVIIIKKLLDFKIFSNKEIAEKFEVTPNSISCIKTGRRWAHI